VLPGLMICAAEVADVEGAHGLARDALLAALPFAAVGALVVLGDFIESPRSSSGLRAICAGAMVCMLVLSCAVRSGAGDGAVPPLAISSLVAVLCLLALQAVCAAVPGAKRLGLFPAKP
jgi:hypothetical protein